MPGTIAWIALLAAAVALEIACRRSSAGRRWLTLPATLRGACARATGRFVVLAAWAFLGFHLFARYTLPGHH